MFRKFVSTTTSPRRQILTGAYEEIIYTIKAARDKSIESAKKYDYQGKL